MAGFGRRVITPRSPVWLAGYGSKREPEAVIHDIWVKVMALQSPDGERVVMATTDNQGMSRSVYDEIFEKIHDRFGLKRSEFMVTFSHNHCGPRLRDDLHDYYPVDEKQEKLVDEYSSWMAEQVAKAVGEALENWKEAELLIGEGYASFAVNRRENVESGVPEMLANRIPLEGPVDHYVPVLAIREPAGNLLGVLFGYACHPTTLSFNRLCGDYPGFAQINLEKSYPGINAMFFNACGGDQNPLPRRKLALCERYGEMLSTAVERVLAGPMKPLSTGIHSAFRFVDLDYEEVATRETLLPVANGESELHARWARRLLKKLEEGAEFPVSYLYPVQAWKLGDELLLLGLGGEAVVDYSLRFKRDYAALTACQTTWICGYANEMISYIPSRRVWEEGGYEGAHIDEYGHPAWRWTGDVEERIATTTQAVVRQISSSHPAHH